MATLYKTDGTKVDDVNISTLKSMQDLVGGYIEFVYLPNKKVMIVDEEGLLKNYSPNKEAISLSGRLIVGDVILADYSEVN
jgi:predicted transcriptional regulator|tara:strand:+ start:257 stop:499 length:243 start_codon:yes stop_codon:yes gene_type:complete